MQAQSSPCSALFRRPKHSKSDFLACATRQNASEPVGTRRNPRILSGAGRRLCKARIFGCAEVAEGGPVPDNI